MCIPALGLLGGLVSAAGAFTGARAQSAQSKAQARFAERQAETERARGAVEAKRQRRAGETLFGGQIVRFAKGGASLTGSPSDVLSNIRTENELDTDRIRLNSRAREDRQRFSASLNRSRARAAAQRGIFAALSPLVAQLRQRGRTTVPGR